jgi:autoinducer 2-degrading protein
MFVTVVRIRVKEAYLSAFIQSTKENHHHSLQEKGNLRFDFLQERENPCQFILYEAYVSEEVAKAHKTTNHYLKWRAEVEPWMAAPREGIACTILEPQQISRWKP